MEEPQNQTPLTPQSAPHNIRTFQSDIAEIIKSGDGSLAKIAMAESEKRAQGNYIPEEPETISRGKLLVITSFVLIFVGIATVSIFYFLSKKPPENAVNRSQKPPTLILTDEIKPLNIAGLNREPLIKTLTEEGKNTEAPLSSVVGFELREGTGESAPYVKTASLFERLNTGAPSELVRSLADTFLYGIHFLNVHQPFLVLKTSYYQNAFAGMLAWEKTMETDIGPLFFNPKETSTPVTSDELLSPESRFEDIVIKNRDTRALLDSSGNILFLYSFPDKNTIVITTNADTLEKVSTQLIAGKLIQ